MALSLDDIARIAHLARLEIEPCDAVATLGYLNGVFGLIEQMQAVDTAAIEPMAHAQEFALRLREDRVTESDQRARFQDIAPQAEAGLYLVPRVIE